MSDQDKLLQIPKLTQALIASGACNILLLAFILYGLFGDGILLVRDHLEPRIWKAQQGLVASAQERTIRHALQSFQQLSMSQLIDKLEDITLIEDGYHACDLALGYLVWRHHFNLTKALADLPPASTRQLPIRCGGKLSHLTLYPGLSQKQFDKVIHFGKTERWPQTSEGLFQLLRKEEQTHDPMLAEAFYLSSEFLIFQRAFSRLDIALGKEELLVMLLHADWTTLTCALAKLQAQGLPSDWLQSSLAEYLRRGSQTAAKLLAQQGSRKLDDETALLVMRLLGGSAKCEAFASQLLSSPRSDLVWEEAKRFSGEVEPLTKSSNLASKASFAIPSKEADPTLPKVYIVQAGDSLWKISKLLHVDVNQLKAHNSLTSDLVRPGFRLRIP